MRRGLLRLTTLPLAALLPVLLPGFVVACAAPTAAESPAAPAQSAPEAPPASLNDSFLAPDVDVAHWAEVFESESREIAAARDAIAATLELAPGMTVADVGAGTGLFLPVLAAGVGPEGRVYAVDISPRFIEHLEDRVEDEGLDQVRTVLCTDHSAGLPEASVDVVFVCDTYHHFDHPRDTLASLHRALRPRGRLVIVDFERVPGTSRDWVLEHVRAGKETFRAEIEAAGFALEDEPTVAGLRENYVLRFRRR